ncbi:hypothetical protein BKA56DRAFT_467443, partial [Ilyonectria sp. MPI-CAGE-AT-0026]
LLTSVSSALAERAEKHIFAIGGKVDGSASSDQDADVSVVVRWDSAELGQGWNVRLPVGDDAVSKSAFAQLLADCQPAAFEVGSEGVLNETYRRASSLDASKFSTDFHPYENGILDTVIQGLAHGAHPSDRHNSGIRAELHKLNIYSGPSGRLESYISTPRSTEQMGSLVVCLPHAHQGGQLAVRHSGREVVFDWTDAKKPSIQWAAFFSDCEHEILEVTQGHQLILTYNLFWISYGPALMSNHLGVLEQESFHFFASLKSLLNCPTFLPKGNPYLGGIVGFTCTHTYPHISRASIPKLHHALKGLDMMVYQSLLRLTGNARVAAVLDDEEYQADLRECRALSPDRVSQATESEDAAKFHERDASLATHPCPTIFWDVPFQDEHVDPAEIGWDDGAAFPRCRVTWLNHAPNSQTSLEVAIAYNTVSGHMDVAAFYSSAVIIADVS